MTKQAFGVVPETLESSSSYSPEIFNEHLTTGGELSKILEAYDEEGRRAKQEDLDQHGEIVYADTIETLQLQLAEVIERFSRGINKQKKQALIELSQLPNTILEQKYPTFAKTYKKILIKNMESITEPFWHMISVDEKRNNLYIYTESGDVSTTNKQLKISGLVGDETQFLPSHRYPPEDIHTVNLRPHHTVRGNYEENTIEACCDYIKDFLDYKQRQDISLEGNSIGGQIVAEFASKYPHLLRTLMPSAPSGLTQDADIVRDFLAILLGNLEGPGAEAIFTIYSTKKKLLKRLPGDQKDEVHHHRNMIFDGIGEQIERLGAEKKHGGPLRKRIHNIQQNISRRRLSKTIQPSRNYFQENSKRSIPNISLKLLDGVREQIHDEFGEFGVQEINKKQYRFLSNFVKFLFYEVSDDETKQLINEKADMLLSDKHTFAWFIAMAKETDKYKSPDNLQYYQHIAQVCKKHQIKVIFTGGQDDPVVDVPTMHIFYELFKDAGVDTSLILMPNCKHAPTLEKNSPSYVVAIEAIQHSLEKTL